jgi:hypothetical protein
VREGLEPVFDCRELLAWEEGDAPVFLREDEALDSSALPVQVFSAELGQLLVDRTDEEKTTR